MKKSIALLLSLALTASLSAQVFITGFGTDDFEDAGSDPALETTAFTSRFAGDTSGMLIGTFIVPVNIDGYTAALTFTATVDENPGTAFVISLYDSEFNPYEYAGSWGDFVTGVETTVTLTAVSGQTGPFDFTQVVGMGVTFDSGLGGEPLDITMNTLTAVPEPAAFALFAGLAGLGGVMMKRRRV